MPRFSELQKDLEDANTYTQYCLQKVYEPLPLQGTTETYTWVTISTNIHGTFSISTQAIGFKASLKLTSMHEKGKSAFRTQDLLYLVIFFKYLTILPIFLNFIP